MSVKTKPLVLHLAAIFLGFSFTWVGIQHFTDTEWFEPIVPKFFENARFWVLVTGYMEIGLGLGLIIPKTRRIAAIGTFVFLLGIYWANLNMWVNDIPLGGVTYGQSFHIIRLSIQILMIITTLLIAGGIYDVPEKMRS